MMLDKVSKKEPVSVAHSDSEPAISLGGVSVRFDGFPALENISLTIDSGLRVAVVGPNGAGKSTLFNVLAGILPPTSGQVLIHGHLPTQHLCLAYVPQSSLVDWNFPVNVEEVVMMGRIAQIGLFHQPRRADWEQVRSNLDRVNLVSLGKRQISELSGGQKQRMFIARALAQQADLILLDEPLAGLDIPSQDQILAILDDLKKQRITVLFATHDLELAGEQFDRILLLNRRLVAYGTKDQVLTAANLTQAFGGHLQLIDTVEGKLTIADSGGHHRHEVEGRHG